jgi:CHASE2 domain-containing sensor protein
LSHWLQLLLSGLILISLILVAFVWRQKKWQERIAQLFSDVLWYLRKQRHSIKQWPQSVKELWHSKLKFILLVPVWLWLWQKLSNLIKCICQLFLVSFLCWCVKGLWHFIKKPWYLLHFIKNLPLKFWHFIKNLPLRFWRFIKILPFKLWHLIVKERKYPAQTCKFINSLVIGLAIMGLIMAFHHSALVMDIQDAGMDWLMQINANIIPPIAEKEKKEKEKEKNIPAFVLVDINDETYHAWGEPLFTPRKRLTNLIKAAVGAKARMVIVDIDVSQPMPVERSPLHPDDQVLKNYLEDYVTKCKEKENKPDKSACPPILLLRTFSAKPTKIPVPRTGFLEEIVAQSAPYLEWASAHFSRADDQVVRRWKLWQEACTADKQPQIVPSIELLAMAKVQGCTAADIENALEPFRPQNCEKKYRQPKQKTVKLCQLEISTDKRGIHQRIMYGMSWERNKNSPLHTQAGELILTICQAQGVESGTDSDCLKNLNNSIVVIGGSYRDGGDVHLTPLDDMPGSLIIINAIHSLLEYGTIDSFSVWWNLLLTVVLIVIMSLLFARFTSFWGMVLSGAVIIFAVLPLAIFWFSEGIWFDFALPLIVVQVYRIASNFEECRNKQKAPSIGAFNSN